MSSPTTALTATEATSQLRARVFHPILSRTLPIAGGGRVELRIVHGAARDGW